MVPVAYFSEKATIDYLENDSDTNLFQYFLDRAIHRDPGLFEKFSSGTSACLFDRYYYLYCGGTIEDFAGWGFEDLELNCRVIFESGRYPIPDDWLMNISSFDFQTSYHGWKSIYRLFGDRSFAKGLILFHAWHPIVTHSSYRQREKTNRKLFKFHMERFLKTHKHPPALFAHDRGKTLMFRQNAFTFAPELQPLLGHVTVEKETRFVNKEDFLDYFEEGSFDRILFHNPYATPEMQNLYNWAREGNLPFFVAERGALNDSIFFDNSGFLADSILFKEKHWDKPLDETQSSHILEYIRKEKLRVELLESQGERVSENKLRNELQLGQSDKVILVCLQRPSDTATQFFFGELGSYHNYIEALTTLSRELPSNHRMLIKLHPLEREVPSVKGDNVSHFHLYDLLNIADQLLVFNSGTGVQAMMWNVPIITCGRTFYDHDTLTHHVRNYRELKSAAMGHLPVNMEKRLRFLFYLVGKYYSFGKFTTRQSRLRNGERITSTTEIDFNVLRFDNIDLKYRRASQPQDDWQSMLFDRYMWQKKENSRVLKHLRQKNNLATRIFIASRNVPVAEKCVDFFVPIYKKWKYKD